MTDQAEGHGNFQGFIARSTYSTKAISKKETGL